MAGQENVEHRRSNRRDQDEEESAAPAAKEADSALDGDVDAILDAKGEGLIGVVWAVADADRAKEAAERLGVPSFFTLDYDQDQIDANLQGRFTKYYQHFLMPSGPLGDAQVLVGEFETPD